MAAAPVAIEEQIACVERELGLRQKIYPRWIRDGKLTKEAADVELVRMSAVLLTLQRIQRQETLAVPGAEDIRRGAEARVLTAVAGMVHTDVYMRLVRKLARPAP